jgi:hypothetical protein
MQFIDDAVVSMLFLLLLLLLIRRFMVQTFRRGYSISQSVFRTTTAFVPIRRGLGSVSI